MPAFSTELLFQMGHSSNYSCFVFNLQELEAFVLPQFLCWCSQRHLEYECAVWSKSWSLVKRLVILLVLTVENIFSSPILALMSAECTLNTL